MEKSFPVDHEIDYVEIYSPMVKPLAYWHVHALGFSRSAILTSEGSRGNSMSCLLVSGKIKLVLTSTYTNRTAEATPEIQSFITANYCGVRRIALAVDDVKKAFEKAIASGGIPTKLPTKIEDEDGYIEEAAIRLYDYNEILFINRDNYRGVFRPGYRIESGSNENESLIEIDHIASEVRINESEYWTNYVTKVLGTELVQNIGRSNENRTGMILRINQSGSKGLTLVMAEPDIYNASSKVQQNIDNFGPGIHHLAFLTYNLPEVVARFSKMGIEFVKFPAAYYTLLRNSDEFKGFDIDELERLGILIDKEGDSYLLQKFIKPISDRPFFLYELVQRVNGYNGFALKNINVLKKAEEMEVIK